MARLVPCIALLLGLAACEGDPDAARLLARSEALAARADDLVAERDDARARARQLARRLEAASSRLERDRTVDVWTGGPTIGGAFLALPRLGVLRWTCDDARRFHLGFAPGGASVRVQYRTSDRSRSRMVHPDGRMRATVGAGETMTWTITHRHPPGFIRASVDVATATSRHGNCLLARVALEERGRLYD